MNAMIEVEHLSKSFHLRRHRGLKGFFSREVDVVRAVSDISFTVGRGEIVGYLGPNGAGKSTTIKMLSGLLVPSAGDVRVNGFVPWRERRRFVGGVGVVFGQRSTLWWDLPVIESLELLGHIYRVPKGRFDENLRRFTNLLDLAPFLNAPVRSLSLGQRMRADLAAALLHDPELLFLDEPTIGLDVVAKERIREFVAHVNHERGVTVVLTTHDLADVERLAKRVMIIDHGALLFDGALRALTERFGGERQLVVDFAESVARPYLPGARLVSHDGVRAVFAFPQAASAAELIAHLSALHPVRDLGVKEPDIEATIRAIYEGGLLRA